MPPFSVPWNVHDVRLKFDFEYYVKCRILIPNRPDPERYIITKKHKEAIGNIQDHDFSVLEAYRWFGKSELVSYCWVLWRADMWNESAVILSANEDLAMQKLDLIRTAIEFENQELAHLSGKGVAGIIWNRWEIWLVDRANPIINDLWEQVYRIKSKIYAKGIFANYRGLHVHNIVGDDIVVEDNSQTYEMRESTKRRFLAAAMGMRLNWKHKSHVVVVGTPQHPDDLLAELCDKNNTAWSKCIVPVFNDLGEPNCIELHDHVWIDQQRKIQGEAIFKQEYLLTPISLESETFAQDLIDMAKDYASIMCLEYEKKKDEVVILGTDFAIEDDPRKAQKNDTDFFSIVALCYNTQTWERRILNAFRERGIKKQIQLNYLIIWDVKYNANYIGTETHGFLKWVGQDLPDRVRNKLIDTGTHKSKYDLFEGIPSMVYEWEKGLYSIPYGDDYSRAIANILFGELRDLASSEHDDMADALLRAEKVIKNNETAQIGYQKDFSLYKKIAEPSIPSRLIDSRHVWYREQPRQSVPVAWASRDTQPAQASFDPFQF